MEKKKTSCRRGVMMARVVVVGLVLMVMGMAQAVGQHTVRMTCGTLYVDGCNYPSGVIYDDGGSLGGISKYFDGMVIIKAGAGDTITLSGLYNLRYYSCGLTIYDGEGMTGNKLIDNVVRIGLVNVVSTTGVITIHLYDYHPNRHNAAQNHGINLSYNCRRASHCTRCPQNLRLEHLTQTGAHLAWHAADTGSRFALRVDDSTMVVADTTFTIDGLAPGSQHMVEVRSLEDSMSVECRQQMSFRTLCEPLRQADLPLCYGFEDATGEGPNATIDSCWTLVGSHTSPLYPSPLYPLGGRFALLMAGCSGEGSAYLVLPEYADSLSRTALDFWVKHADSWILDRYEVGIMENPMDLTSFETIATLLGEAEGYVHHTVSFEGYNGSGHFVAIRILNKETAMYVDDIRLRTVEACPAIGEVAVNALAPRAMQVSWTTEERASSSIRGYQLRISPLQGGTPTELFTTRCNSMVSGLEPGTDYAVAVRVCCTDSSYGEWDSIVVSTPSLCIEYTNDSGQGSSNLWELINTQLGNNACQSIYTESQLSSMGLQAGYISAIEYTWSMNRNYPKTISIFIGQTTQRGYSWGGSPLTFGQTLVYSGNLQCFTSGPQTYVFTTPFYWDGVSNLVVTLLVNQPNSMPQDASPFFMKCISNNSGLFSTFIYGRDSVAIRLNDLGTVQGSVNTMMPSVRFVQCNEDEGCRKPLVAVSEVGIREVTLQWTTDSTANEWNIAYRAIDDSIWTSAARNYDRTELQIGGLTPGTPYQFRVTALCDSGQAEGLATAATACRQGAFEYDNLYGPSVTCYTGSYGSYPRVEVVNYGSSNMYSRHTIHRDLQETDPRTDGQLYTVPEGYCSSVRLGNWNNGKENEHINYTYRVDTNDYNLLILKYAAVLENPNHWANDQPRFHFSITDSTGHTINPCYEADFVSSTNLGWNVVNRTNVLWKDWTTIGVDLVPLHGQLINIKLSSYDCSIGAHFGYAYYVIDLDNKLMRSVSCNSEENTFYAPVGFAYRWYAAEDTSTTLSNADSLHTSGSGIYKCDLSYLGAPNDSAHADCHFTLTAVAGERHPYARFTAWVTDTMSCSAVWMRMQNQSIITRDSAHTDSVADGCESYLWNFDDGTSSTEIHPRHAFHPGWHTATLFAMLADGSCVDTAVQQFYVPYPCTVRDTVYDTICPGDTAVWYDSSLTAEGTYIFDSLISQDSLLEHRVILTQLSNSVDTLRVSVCRDYLWEADSNLYNEEGAYDYVTVAASGCDSIVTLVLSLIPPFDTNYYDTIYQGDTVYFQGMECILPGDYVSNSTSEDGCDTTRILHLLWRYIVPDSLTDSFCHGYNYPFDGRLLTSSGTYYDTIFSPFPIPDTLRVLTLKELPLPQVELSGSFECADHPPYTLQAHATVPYYSWSSSPDDPLLQEWQGNDTARANPQTDGIYYVTVDYREEGLCPVTDSIRLIPIHLPNARIDFWPDSLSDIQRALTAYSRNNRYVDHWQWTVWYDREVRLRDTTQNLLLEMPEGTVDLRLALVVSNSHCADSDTVSVGILKSEIYFPNVFTPTLGTNHVFRPVYVNIYDFEIWIYDKRGDLVYHSTDINEGWDGTHSGRLCTQAAYAYKCRYRRRGTSADHQIKIGTVTLLR